MITKKPPPFYWRRRYKTALARFIFENEPGGIKENARWRAQLVRVLNECSGFRWKL